MKNIKLTRTMINPAASRELRQSTHWYTNGHWLVARDRVTQAEKLPSDLTRQPDETIPPLIAGSDEWTYAWERTPLLYRYTRIRLETSTLYQSVTNPRLYTAIDTRYVLPDLDMIYSKNANPHSLMVNASREYFVMPMTLPREVMGHLRSEKEQ